MDKTLVVAIGGSMDALAWTLADPLNLRGSQITIVHVKCKDVESDSQTLARLRSDCKVEAFPHFTFRFVVLTPDRFGVGHTIKAFLKREKPSLFVIKKTDSELCRYLASCDSRCPVALILPLVAATSTVISSNPNDPKSPTTGYSRLLAHVSDSRQSTEMFSFLNTSGLFPSKLQCFLIHGYHEPVVGTDPESEQVRATRRKVLTDFSSKDAKSSVFAVKTALVRIKVLPANTHMASAINDVFLQNYPPTSRGGDLVVVAPCVSKKTKKLRLGGSYTQALLKTNQPILIFKDSSGIKLPQKSLEGSPKLSEHQRFIQMKQRMCEEVDDDDNLSNSDSKEESVATDSSVSSPGSEDYHFVKSIREKASLIQQQQQEGQNKSPLSPEDWVDVTSFDLE